MAQPREGESCSTPAKIGPFTTSLDPSPVASMHSEAPAPPNCSPESLSGSQTPQDQISRRQLMAEPTGVPNLPRVKLDDKEEVDTRDETTPSATIGRVIGSDHEVGVRDPGDGWHRAVSQSSLICPR